MKIKLFRPSKIALASLLFIFCFASSFPFVVPGMDKPLLFNEILSWLFIFPVMPLFLYIMDCCGNLKQQIKFLYLICVPANALVFYWVFYSIHVYGEISFFVTILILLLMFFALSTFWLGFLLLYRFFNKKSPLSSCFIAALWVAVEWLRTFFPVDFYWSAFGHSQYNNKITLQWASIGSIYLISFMIVWLSVYFYQMLRGRRNKKEGVCLALVFVSLLIYSIVKIEQFKAAEPTKEVKTAIMQPSINQFDINSKEQTVLEIIDVFTKQINSFDKDSELLVWHEAAIPVRVPVNFYDFDYIMNRYFVNAYNFPNQIVGLDMVDEEREEFFNAAGFVQNGEIRKIYKKIKLAPFGEYLPMSDFLHSIGLSTLVPGSVGSFIRGKEHVVYDYGGFKASILICYDGTFSENVREFVKNGAELLVNISNDAWFGYSSEIFQHGSFYPFRAVETGRTIIRAANVGISEVILPDGSRENSTRLFERTVINRKIPLYNIETIYQKYGDWFLYSLLAVVFVSFIKRFLSQKLDVPVKPRRDRGKSRF